MDSSPAAASAPVVLVTNDDGIDAPGLRFLIELLVAARRFRVLVCAPDTDSGINVGNNCGYHVVYSGTVGGAREAFIYGIPAIAMSYDWVAAQRSVNDLKVAAEVCIPLINTIMVEIKNGAYPPGSFLNVDMPTDAAHHKGYKITKQGRYMARIGWEQTVYQKPAVQSYQTANMDVDSEKDSELVTSSENGLLFKRVLVRQSYDEEEGDDIDHKSLVDGYITVTPLGALSRAEADVIPYYKTCLSRLTDNSSSSSL